MTYDNPGDRTVSTQFKLPTYHPDRLCHIFTGRLCRRHRSHQPHGKCFATGERIAWVEPIPTGRNGEYISVMSRRITPSE